MSTSRFRLSGPEPVGRRELHDAGERGCAEPLIFLDCSDWRPERDGLDGSRTLIPENPLVDDVAGQMEANLGRVTLALVVLDGGDS